MIQTWKASDDPVIQRFNDRSGREGQGRKRLSVRSGEARDPQLTVLEYATTLDDLRSPPGNHLEALKGDRKGQHSIRINDQWRVCFIWTNTGPEQVEITDYH